MKTEKILLIAAVIIGAYYLWQKAPSQTSNSSVKDDASSKTAHTPFWSNPDVNGAVITGAAGGIGLALAGGLLAAV